MASLVSGAYELSKKDPLLLHNYTVVEVSPIKVGGTRYFDSWPSHQVRRDPGAAGRDGGDTPAVHCPAGKRFERTQPVLPGPYHRGTGCQDRAVRRPALILKRRKFQGLRNISSSPGLLQENVTW